MMADTEADIGGFKGLEAETQLSSHQDLTQVGADCGGTKLDSVDCNGNGNVRGTKLGGSYVFVSGVVEVSVNDSIVDENFNAESEPGVDLKDDTVVEVKIGEVVVETGGNDQAFAVVEDNNCVLSVVTDKEVVVPGESIGEFVENATSGQVENGQPDIEVKVENQVESEPGENPESQSKTGSALGENQVTVIISAEGGELSDKSVKDVEQNIIVSMSELGESEQSNTISLGANRCEFAKVEADVGEGKSEEQTEVKSEEEGLESQIRIAVSVDCMSHELEKDQNKFKQMKDLGCDAELGESQEAVIKVAETGELSDKSVKAVEQDLVASPTDFGESKQSDTVVLEADGCELANIEAGFVVDVGVGKSKEQTELKSVKERLESQIRITGYVDCVSPDLEEDGYKFKHMTNLPSEIDGGVQLGNNIDAVAYKGLICKAAADDYKVARDKELDECNDGSQSVDELDSTPSYAATLCSIDKVPTECGENITASTIDGAAVKHEASRSVIVKPIGAANLVDLDSDISQICAESIGHVPDKIQGPVNADCGVDLVQGYEAERVVHDTDGKLTTQITTRPVTDQTMISPINPGERIGGCTNSSQLIGNSDDAQSNCIVLSDESFQFVSSGATTVEPKVGNLACPTTENISNLETKKFTEDVESGILSATDDTKSETEVANGLSISPPNDVRSGMKIEFGTIDTPEEVSKSWGGNALSKSHVTNGLNECAWKQSISTTNSAKSESCADMSFKSDVQYRSAISHSDMPGKDAAGSKVPSESASLLDCSINNSLDGQNLGVVAKANPFQFLVKYPRFDDDKLREQTRDSQLLVEEKTVRRDNIKCEFEMKRAKLQSLGDEFEATKSNERAARRLVKLKREEIESVQAGINRLKNSISVMDITNRITHMEHMIEHETHPLKEEMQLLHEINQMKKLRSQISTNVCSPEEVTQALSRIEPTEIQLKTLKKELGDLKEKVSKAQAAVILLGREYNDESRKLRELQAQFRAANDIRQDAYKDFLGLKRQVHEKSKHFWIYKDDAKAASDYALNRDREALYRLCANQVETFMDIWNKNDDFREDYVRCNMKSTLRRFKTLDGRSLGPDEEVPIILNYTDERDDRQLSSPSRTTYPSSATILKQENTVQPVETEPLYGKSLVLTEPKSKMLKSKTSVEPIPGTGLHIGSGQLEAVETKEKEEQHTEEQLESVRKAEMLRKEEIAATLKEQLRQEERLKSQEALERKKRSAEKAHMKAVLRAQKEAEQKEKEREKRLRKKEKKNADGESDLELQTNSTKDESNDSPRTKPSKTSHFNKYSKPKATIPPALRNRGKRRLKELVLWILCGLVVLFLFVVGNGGAFGSLKPLKDDKFLGNHLSQEPV